MKGTVILDLILTKKRLDSETEVEGTFTHLFNKYFLRFAICQALGRL